MSPYQFKPLADLCTITSGTTPSKKQPRFWDGDLPWVSAKDLKGDVVRDTQLKLTQHAVSEANVKIATTGSLLVLVRGMGLAHGVQVAEAGVRCAFNQDIRAITPESNVYKRYLLHALRWAADHEPSLIKSAAHGTLKVDAEDLRRLPIPLPPLAEQIRIVAILDEAFEAIERAEECHGEAITRANLLTERIADQTLREVHARSELRSLKDWGLKTSTGPFGSLLHKSDYVKGGMPLINPVNLVHGAIEVDAAKTVANDALDRLARYRLNAGDVLVARRGEIGRCAPVPPEANGWLCGTGCFVIRANDCAESRYLAWLIRAGPNHDRLVRASSRATMPSISNKDLANLEIALPPLAEQVEIVERIDAAAEQVRELRGVHERNLEAITTLRQAMLRKAFRGSLAKVHQPAEVHS